jgi:hypothetical protein
MQVNDNKIRNTNIEIRNNIEILNSNAQNFEILVI